MKIVTIETASLGDRSYVVTDGEVAAVVDPQRDIDRVLTEVNRLGVVVTDVFETHVHNDYVTGGHELAERLGARYHLHADDEVAFEREPIRDGDEVAVGSLTIRAIHTPGHTPTHLSYAVRDGDRDVAVFTGGSMLFGSVGRTDLIDPARTEELTREQYRSAHRLAELLDDQAEVLPTHGFGSFCSSGDTSGSDASTIGQEKRDNQALTIADEDEFVRQLIDGLDAYPAYYAHMGPANRAVPAPVDLSPVAEVDVTELLRRIHAGEWVVDLRTRTAFASDHVGGTINVELADAASTYIGWLIDWGTPVTLLADGADEIAEMQRQLVRIGIDRPAGRFVGGSDAVDGDAPHGTYRVVDFAGAASARSSDPDLWILDARRNGEWEESHVVGAHHVPLHEIEPRIDELPTERDVWVHCASGYRASIAASLIARSGRTPVLIDDDFAEHAAEHLEVTE